MDVNTYNESLNELMQMFYKRMDSFEGKLQKTPASPSTETLAAEFASFKAFVFKSMRALQSQIQLLAKETDQLEMRGRRKILLIHGVPENSKENTAEVMTRVVVEQLKLPAFVIADISRCHRMGRTGNPAKPRPILCKFREVTLRDRIWSSKASLKGSGVTVSEFLTKARHTVFMAARLQFGITKCWTREGYIFVVDSGGARHRICCQPELDAISPKDLSKQVAAAKASAGTSEVAPTKQKRAAAKK